MPKKKVTSQGGFTLVELMVALLLAVIVISGLGIILSDSQRGWQTMYNRIYSDVVTDSYIAEKTFDSLVRKANYEKVLIDTNGNWVEVYYYANDASTSLDRYARFYKSGSLLNVEYGTLNPKATLRVQTLCQNVSSCTFKGAGKSIQMVLKLNNGSQTATVVSSSFMNN